MDRMITREFKPGAAEKVLYLMQGVPGSGKSTIAEMIRQSYEERAPMPDRALIISTDDHRLEPDGSYKFVAADNARFHKLTQRDCARLMRQGQRAIIVDNTNIQGWQAHPYLVLADIYDYTVQVVSVDCGLPLAIERQGEREGLGDRRVPPEVITDMYGKMERLLT